MNAHSTRANRRLTDKETYEWYVWTAIDFCRRHQRVFFTQDDIYWLLEEGRHEGHKKITRTLLSCILLNGGFSMKKIKSSNSISSVYEAPFWVAV